ncbi:hypothetical protein FACS1894152_7900 [Bacilli bacterium]|nr:hypothetical protein FACS1894152_7900 [Bacilli bacterium]
MAAKICKSNSDARRLIESKGVMINGKLIEKFDQSIKKQEAINRQFSYIKKGKKDFFLIK